ncbi:MAG: type II toxin-antitoxin system ParD family antitoxin [Bryobacteraceae bacterium]
MTITLKPEVEALIQKRLASGVFQNIDEVIYRALESQDAEESWLQLHNREVSEKIARAIAEADRGECMAPEHSRALLEEKKEAWRSQQRH